MDGWVDGWISYIFTRIKIDKIIQIDHIINKIDKICLSYDNEEFKTISLPRKYMSLMNSLKAISHAVKSWLVNVCLLAANLAKPS